MKNSNSTNAIDLLALVASSSIFTGWDEHYVTGFNIYPFHFAHSPILHVGQKKISNIAGQKNLQYQISSFQYCALRTG